jgi:undecaprenyl-diphosphatase
MRDKVYMPEQFENKLEIYRQRIFSRELIMAFGLFLFALILFGYLTREVLLEKQDLFDVTAFSYMESIDSPARTQVALFLSFFGTGSFLIPVYLAMIIYFIRTQRMHYAIQIFVISFSSLLLGCVLKDIFRRPRPLLQHLDAAGGYSFPSGHTLGGFTLIGILIYLVWKSDYPLYTKIIGTVGSFSFGCLIGLSRIYLQVHFASDTIAGFFVAVIWLSFSLIIIKLSKPAKYKLIF